MNPKMKEILKITLNLTVVCFFAGAILGLTNMATQHAKEINLEKRENSIRLGLLGYDPAKPVPSGLSIETIARFMIFPQTDNSRDNVLLGYLVPQGAEQKTLILLTPEGEQKGIVNPCPDPLSADGQKAIAEALGQSGLGAVEHLENYLVAVNDNNIIGYLLTGDTLGFKANIRLIVALNPDFSVRGVDLLESEEDPGLGDEAKQPYFKNQYIGKSHDQIAQIKVEKTPLPDDYRKILESSATGNFSPEDMAVIKDKYAGSPIYSLTGATISSDAVTSGVKKIVGRFYYRLNLLEKSLTEAGLQKLGA